MDTVPSSNFGQLGLGLYLSLQGHETVDVFARSDPRNVDSFLRGHSCLNIGNISNARKLWNANVNGTFKYEKMDILLERSIILNEKLFLARGPNLDTKHYLSTHPIVEIRSFQITTILSKGIRGVTPRVDI